MNKHSVITAPEAFKLLCNTNNLSVIDVRSQGEYEKAHFGKTVNIPILSDLHRHDVGLTYKTEGSQAAKLLGHQLVSGAYKDQLIQRWCESIKSHPQQRAFIFCWRGGCAHN